MAGFCTVPDCLNLEHASGLCVGHFRRKARGRPVGTPLREVLTPFSRLEAAALAYADAPADDDAEFHRLQVALRRAALALPRPVEAEASTPVPERA